MIKCALFLVCVVSSLALPALLPGSLPATTSSKYARFSEVGGRIVHGVTATRGQFPYQAALYLYRTAGTYFCGGSLISVKWILTAGHCIEDLLGVNAFLGIVSLSGLSDGLVGIRVVGHPSYSATSLVNDVALIELSTTVALSQYVGTISLASTTLVDGASVTVSGFGRTSDDATSISGVLAYVSLTSITNTECSKTFGSVTPGIVCAIGRNNESTCNGDSGGPLVTGSGNNVVQVGIVSFVSALGCDKGYPSGYTRTAYYKSWIASIVDA